MDAWKTGRTMQPRSQIGTSLLVAMQLLATDENIFLGRVSFKDPSAGGRVTVAHDDLPLWSPLDVRENFASGLAAAVWDACVWTTS